MVARFAGASLGLLAFSITAFAGLYVQNPIAVTLARSILALFVFFFIGLALGGAAELVVREYEKGREADIRKRFEAASTGHDGASGGQNESVSGAASAEAQNAATGT
ncbi:MAG: hypothetical protein JSU63_00945 [Phycisphaerales bacterium]|nr:MAG: hypothetical protein JSU63_00945 [Phycisphaerales bacterium]